MSAIARWRVATLGLLCIIGACANTRAPDTGTAAAGIANTEPTCPETRRLTCAPRRETPRVTVHNADLLLAPGIGFHVRDLVASLVARDPQAPAIPLDDLQAFAVRAHRGTVVMSPTQLSALFNAHVFAQPGALLRDIRIETSAGRLTLAGEYQRDGWVDFTLAGRLEQRGPTRLDFIADEIRVAGRPVAEVLAAAHVEIDDILRVDAPGVQLNGNTVALDITALLPRPKIELAIADARLTDAGLVLALDDGRSVAANTPAEPADSYLLVQGGAVHVMRIRLRNTRLQLVAADAQKPFALSLASYRDQLARGRIDLLENGPRATFIAQLPAPGDDPPDPFRPSPAAAGEPVWLHARDAELRLGAVGVHALDLLARLEPAETGEPINLDDPKSFTATVAQGCARLAPDALDALFNRHVFNAPPRTLSDLAFDTNADGLAITGQAKLWHWFPPFGLPFRAQAPLELGADGLLRYTPESLRTLGIPAGGALDLLHLNLDTLLDIDRPGLRLDGNTLVLDPTQLLPALRIESRPTAISLDTDGVTLCYDGPDAPGSIAATGAGERFIRVYGGTVHALGQVLIDARIRVESTTETLSLRVGDHRGQVARGHLAMGRDGTIMITLAPPARDHAGPAADEE